MLLLWGGCALELSGAATWPGLMSAGQHASTQVTAAASSVAVASEANTCPQLATEGLLQCPEEVLEHDAASQQLAGYLMLPPPLFQARAVPQQRSGCRS